MWKILIQLDSSLQYDQFEVQHAYGTVKIKQVMSNWIFLSFTRIFLFQFYKASVQIHLSHLYPSLHVLYAHMEMITKELKSKMYNFSSFWCSCKNKVSQMWKILIQLDSSLQYDRFEVQHAYVMIKIKEVMSNWIFLSFTAYSHFIFLNLLFRYIYLICTRLSMYNMPI